ncbi:beta-lactamase/transpeptidase-like protein [Melanomma pulvis-pyrius CBS 109.77]|uniref:Beta-lactamase/transpeptidase-like protein n=1 Tax=Melanomma pulvis-pyrius CBS 109.77 TaxID=1314802 RepID=A0A6A6X3D3_9PLEO|nr:beta-lactamase/transpeptidase-like protein [Melanomma pulvis-pyrius CBS 109.77]
MAHKTSDFDRLVQELMNEWKVPGLAIAVIHGDEIYTKGYGVAKFPNEKVTADTLFNCASTSKSFTAGAIALLVEDNDKYPNVQWTTPVSNLLSDDFVLPDPQYTENVTIEDILSHRSGMPGHDSSYLGIHASYPDTPKSVTRNLRNLPLSRPLRTEYQYCNMMYTAASYMVEVLSGESYADFLKSRFWDPLQMSNTYHDISGVESGNAAEHLAHGHVWDEKGESYINVPKHNEPEGQGAGCIYSCVKDYAKWVQSMIKGSGPLPRKAHKELVKPRAIDHLDDEDRMPFYSQSLYALGWYVESYRGHTVIGHDGYVTGFKSLMRYMPEKEWGIVIFGNSNGAGATEDILCGHLIDELLNIPTPERVDWATFRRDRYKKYKEKENEDENKDLPVRPNTASAVSVPLTQFAGKYHNAGYHDLVLKVKDAKLQADCSDRCFGFVLFFEHIFQDVFITEMQDSLDGSKSRIRAEFQRDAGGQLSSLGVAFEEDMKDQLIWFTRVEST